MKTLSGKELCRILERFGWQLLRINGSHHIYGKEGSKVRLTVPVHGAKALKKGLTLHLIKSAGLKEEDLD